MHPRLSCTPVRSLAGVYFFARGTLGDPFFNNSGYAVEVITVPHRLGAEEAKRRIAERIELLRRDYIDKLAYSEANWNGDIANLRLAKDLNGLCLAPPYFIAIITSEALMTA